MITDASTQRRPAAILAAVRPGDVIGDRFVLEAEVGTGGMGTVWRAADRLSGEPVAVKVLHGLPTEDRRFEREGAVLAGLTHPGIVRYVAHGSRPGEPAFLAMEWLDGEPLDEALSRRGLTMQESVALVRRVAEALTTAHRRGLVHRDLKTANLFLVEGDPDRVKLIDFGIVRVRDAQTQVTRTGTVMGTPHYMAPEQAMGSDEVDARADVFSLGCVLFELLTGRLPFEGEVVTAVLVKVIMQPAPTVSSLRTGLPASLDRLVDWMLRKEPEARPADADAVLRALREVETLPDGEQPTLTPRPASLALDEQRFICALLAEHSGPAAPAATLRGRPGAAGSPDETLRDSREGLQQIAARHGGEVVFLADDTLLVTWSSGNLVDLAGRAARCALALRPMLPGTELALAAGRADLSGRSPVGEVIDRGVAALQRGSGGRPSIRLDDLMADLLEPRFGVERRPEGPTLAVGGSDLTSADRPAEATPHVGRERELLVLESIFEECAEEPCARAALVTGRPGFGKSRLLAEVAARLQADSQPPTILGGAAEEHRAGSPFSVLASTLRRAAGITDSAPGTRRALEAVVQQAGVTGDDEPTRTAAFLGEIARIPFPDEAHGALRAARANPGALGDQMRAAWLRWLAALCRRGPVALLLDGLHWGDQPSVQLLDATLRALRELPLLVVAAARPEVYETFPGLWRERGLLALEIAPLPRRAATKLVSSALGTEADPARVDELVRRGGGNPFFLEELVRAERAPDRREHTLPETVLAMVQARLDACSAEQRRVLRAASVFGASFHPDGVRALVGERPTEEAPKAQLASLERLDLVARDEGGDDGGWHFRQGLHRDAAYAMLTDRDRALGHRLAGAWLEAAGDRDPVMLAHHFEAGEAPERAAIWHRRAAQRALPAGDFIEAAQHAERALEGAADPDERERVLLLLAEARGWQEDYAASEAAIDLVLEDTAAGSRGWYQAVAQRASNLAWQGDFDPVVRLAREVEEAPFGPDTEGARLACLTRVTCFLLQSGEPGELTRLTERCWSLAAAVDDVEPGSLGFLHFLRSQLLQRRGELGESLAAQAASVELFAEAGDTRRAATQRLNLGFAYTEVGDLERAEAELVASIEDLERMGIDNAVVFALQNLARAVGYAGRNEEALALVERAVEMASGPRLAGVPLAYASEILLALGRIGEAAARAEAAVEAMEAVPPLQGLALGHLSRARLAGGDVAGALAAARQGQELADRVGLEEGELLIRLALSEALQAAGDDEAAEQAVAQAAAQIRQTRSELTRPEWREGLARRVPVNARILALAGQAPGDG